MEIPVNTFGVGSPQFLNLPPVQKFKNLRTGVSLIF